MNSSFINSRPDKTKESRVMVKNIPFLSRTTAALMVFILQRLPVIDDVEDFKSVKVQGQCQSWAPRAFGDLGRMAIYFQGAGEHW